MLCDLDLLNGFSSPLLQSLHFTPRRKAGFGLGRICSTGIEIFAFKNIWASCALTLSKYALLLTGLNKNRGLSKT